MHSFGRFCYKKKRKKKKRTFLYFYPLISLNLCTYPLIFFTFLEIKVKLRRRFERDVPGELLGERLHAGDSLSEKFQAGESPSEMFSLVKVRVRCFRLVNIWY